MQTDLAPLVLPSPIPDVKEELLMAIPKLRAFAGSLYRRSGGNVERADDLVQETVVKALVHIDSFAPGSNMTGWLCTILRNEFYSEYRRRRHEIPDHDGMHAAKLRTPAAQEEHVNFLDFRAALDRLRPEHREALILVGASGLSYDDAAGLCACPVGTIKSRVSRARTKLAALLAVPEQYPPFEHGQA